MTDQHPTVDDTAALRTVYLTAQEAADITTEEAVAFVDADRPTPEHPAALHGLLGYVADNLPPESESTAVAAFVGTMLDDPPATEQDAHAMAHRLFARHARELAAMVRTEYPGPDLDEHVRVAAAALERYATRLDGQPTP